MGVIKDVASLGRIIDFIILMGYVYLIIFSQTLGTECNFQDSSCGEDSYCGLDNQCHQFSFHEKLKTEDISDEQQPIFFPLLISTIMIITAIIYRKNDKK